MKNEFVRRLKLARQTKGWTQEELAEHSGIVISTIHYLEKGKNKSLPMGDTLWRLAKALDVSIDWLVGLK